MILANRTVGDNKVISAYGDKLWAQQGHPRAAHLCYILAGTPVSALAAASSARIVTVGADHHKSIRAIFDPKRPNERGVVVHRDAWKPQSRPRGITALPPRVRVCPCRLWHGQARALPTSMP